MIANMVCYVAIGYGMARYDRALTCKDFEAFYDITGRDIAIAVRGRR